MSAAEELELHSGGRKERGKTYRWPGLCQSCGFLVLLRRSLLGAHGGASGCISLLAFEGRRAQPSHPVLNEVCDHKWGRTIAQCSVEWHRMFLEGLSINPGANWERSERQGRSHSFIHLFVHSRNTHKK